MSGFTKLFSAIVYSTVWREEKHTKIVWITMLAISDRTGMIYASVPGLADAARVTIDECEDALAILSAPDPYSRTTDHEGRRIERTEGGWRLLNYQKYREMRDEDKRREQVREAVARHRTRKSSERSPDAPESTNGEPEEHSVVRRVLGVLAPSMRRPEPGYVAGWLKRSNGDLWTLCAALCEAEAGLRRARRPNYVSAIVRERSTAGWAGLSELGTDGCKAYVMHRLGDLI